MLDLYADERRLPAVDPDGRGLLVSCGGALELARLGLAVAGWDAQVHRFPEPTRPKLLARLTVAGRREPDAALLERVRAAEHRRTERRPFGPGPVPGGALDDSSPRPGATGSTPR